MTEILSRYIFWLGSVSLLCLVAERLRPWREEQPLLRPQFGQDVFWLCFNGYFSDFALVYLFSLAHGRLDTAFRVIVGYTPDTVALLASASLWVQIPILLLLADFIEWIVHNALHRSPWLWRFHRVHHSILVMDWIGNFRFHWVETIVYKLVKYLPLAMLGARWETVLVVAVISTTIGHLNHSNLNISWGPLRFILNSPRMHIWHHERRLRGKAGVNFAIVFSFWDWIFRTAHMPKDASQPSELGFRRMETVPRGIVPRFFAPWYSGSGHARR